MKFFDLFKLSMHSIYYNKIRTLITVIIVFVVSLLIMVISILGLSFYESINSAYVALFEETGATFQLNSYYKSSDDGTNEWRNITQAEYEIMMREFLEYPELVDNIYLNSYIENYYFYDLDTKPTSMELTNIYDSHEFYSKYNDSRINTEIISVWGDLDIRNKGVSYIKSGKLWNFEDEGSKKVWVSEAFIAKAASYGYFLDVGDWIVVSLSSWNWDGVTSSREVGAERLRIAGILLNSALEELNVSNDVFIDIMTAFDIIGDNLNINNVVVVSEPKIGFIFNQEYKKMNTVVNNVNKLVPPSKYRNRSEDRFKCDIIESLKMTRIIGAVMNGACLFICFIILIISIGSVANSVIISVDKNKRFLGVMMAVGLRTSGVKKIVQFEALIMIIMATGIAYGILWLASDYFLPIIDFLMQLPGFTDSSKVVMPAYIPIATVLAFIGMALLFARKSLAKIINMDVISVISEVS